MRRAKRVPSRTARRNNEQRFSGLPKSSLSYEAVYWFVHLGRQQDGTPSWLCRLWLSGSGGTVPKGGRRRRAGIDTNLPSGRPAVLGTRAAIRIRERASSIDHETCTSGWARIISA